MPAKFKTSITPTAARNFIANEKKPERATLSCKKITGFHLLKLKRGGAWRYRYTDAKGKRKNYTIGAYPAIDPETAATEALEYLKPGSDPLKDKAKRKRKALSAEEAAKARTFSTYLEGDYTAYQARKKTGTATIAIIKYNFPEWMDRDMATLSASDVDEWQNRRESEGAAYSTLTRAYGALKTMLNQAAKVRGKNGPPPLLDENPLDNVSLEKPIDNSHAKQLVEARQSARRLLTDDEIQKLHDGLHLFGEELRRRRRNSRAHGKPELPDLDAVPYPHWFIPFCYVALYTGMRPGDVASLTWTEANVNFGRITKTPEKTRHHKEPAKISMDMVEPLKRVLKDWHKQQVKPPTGLLFPSPTTGGQLDNKAHRNPWNQVKKLGGLPDDLAFYALRHHFISTLVANGVPLLTVARLVGQKSVAMIEKHYGHLSPDSAAAALAVFAKAVERKEVAHG